MKDSKTIRNEHQSFVDAWKKIQENNSSAPVEEGYKDVKKMLKTNKGYKKESKVLVRKSNAFTALAEKYNMSPKQFGRYVEANQHLFDIPTRKKAILANKFQGFKETKEWDEFFGDLELVEMGFLGKKSKFSKYDDKNKDIIDDGKIDYKKIFKLKKGANLDKAHYEPEGELVERTMTSSEKRKDTMLKKKYDKSDMKKSMQKQYGKEEGKKVYFATIRKQAMGEESQEYVKKKFRGKEEEKKPKEFYQDVDDISKDKIKKPSPRPEMSDRINTPLVDKENKFTKTDIEEIKSLFSIYSLSVIIRKISDSKLLSE